MKKTLRGASIYLVILVMIVVIINYTGAKSGETKVMEFSKIYREIKDGKVSSVHIVEGTSIEGVLKDGKTKFKSYIPSE